MRISYFQKYISHTGQISLNPPFGLLAGNVASTDSIYTFDGQGNITGIKATKSGATDISVQNISALPVGYKPTANFWLDMFGNAYLKGTVYATNGEFTGDVYANNFYFNDGGNVRTLLSQNDKKIDSSFLDLGNIVLDGNTGNISMTGNINMGNASDIIMGGNITLGGNINLSAGSITWGNNSPVKYQFSEGGGSGWHTTMTEDDLYRRDSLDGGISWGSAYQFRGMDGSDANVPDYIKETYIDATRIESPTIRGGEIFGGQISGGIFTNLTGSINDPYYTHWIELGVGSNNEWGFRLCGGNGAGADRNIFGIYDGDFGYTSLYCKGVWVWTHDANRSSYNNPRGNRLEIYSDVSFQGDVFGVVATFG